MLLPLGTHRRIDPIVRPCFSSTSLFGSSRTRASRTSDVSPPPVVRFSKWGGKDSNLHPPPEGAAGASSLYAPAVGRGRESCRTGLVVVSPYVVLHAQPKTASGRTVRLPLAWRSTV